MTKEQAQDFVQTTFDDDNVDDDELREAFVALFEREPDEDEVVDMWSHVCSAVPHCMCSTRTEHERKSVPTEVAIIDCGTVVNLKYDHHEEKMTVVDSGGCPVEEILTVIDWDAELADLAAEILSDWQDGYEGDPHEAGLRVEAKREFEVATAEA